LPRVASRWTRVSNLGVRALLGVLLLVYLGFGVYLYAKQRSFIYFPVAHFEHDFAVERFRSDGESIEVVVLNEGKGNALIYFGGNAEPVVANASAFEQVFSEHTVYLVNYRGYAGSSGSPTEQGLYADASHIYDTIRVRHRNVSVIGRSIGSAVATYLAANRAVKKLVLVTPFDSILNIARDQFPFFPVSLFLKDRYDSYSRVGDVEADTLILVAERDAVIRAKYSDRLASAFPPAQVTVETLEGVGHNGLSAHPGYLATLSRFMAMKP